jgi:hypothetical protein
MECTLVGLYHLIRDDTKLKVIIFYYERWSKSGGSKGNGIYFEFPSNVACPFASGGCASG